MSSNTRISTSTVLERLTPEKRAALDRAIVNRQPPTYTELYERAGLKADGVSFCAFWRYARRLRRSADMVNLAELTGPEDMDLPALMPRLILQSMYGACTHEQASPATVGQLSRAYITMLNARFALEDRQRRDFRRTVADDGCEHDEFNEARELGVFDEFADARRALESSSPDPTELSATDPADQDITAAAPAQTEAAVLNQNPANHIRTDQSRAREAMRAPRDQVETDRERGNSHASQNRAREEAASRVTSASRTTHATPAPDDVAPPSDVAPGRPAPSRANPSPPPDSTLGILHRKRCERLDPRYSQQHITSRNRVSTTDAPESPSAALREPPSFVPECQ